MSARLRLAALLLFGTLVGLALAEGLARVVESPLRTDLERSRYVASRPLMQLEFCESDPDPLLGWRNAPGRSGTFRSAEFSVGVRFNRFGLRGPEVAEKPTPGRPRALFLGDSHTVGWGVEESETFVARIGRERPGWETLNAGAPGYGTRQEWLLLARLGPALEPATVVLVFHPNDPEESFLNIRWYAPRPEPPRYWGLYLPAFIVRAWRARHEPPTPYWRRTNPDYEGAAAHFLDKVRGWCRGRGVRLLVAYLPSKDELVEAEPTGYRLGLGRFCAAERIPFVDLTPALRSEADAYFRLDDHLNARGHAAAARAMLGALDAL